MIFALMQADRFSNLFANGKYRVERGHRFLKNHRHVCATDFPHLLRRQRGQIHLLLVAATQPDMTTVNRATALLHQSHHRQ